MRKSFFLSLAVVLAGSNVWAEETSGICGITAADCNWHYEDGKLTITGTGKMSDFENTTDTPWYALKDNITEIEMSGITTVGARALNYMNNVKNLTIPATVKTLGANSILLRNLESVVFEEGSELKTWSWGPFDQQSKIEILEIPETVTYMSGHAVHVRSVTSLVLPKGVFEKGGYIDYRALHSGMTIYCPKEHQQACEDYLKTAQEYNGIDDENGNRIYTPLENITFQTYEKDGDAYFINGKWYQKPNDVLTGKHIKKLRYTVEEAMKATEKGDKFHVSLTYK